MSISEYMNVAVVYVMTLSLKIDESQLLEVVITESSILKTSNGNHAKATYSWNGDVAPLRSTGRTGYG